jgi:methylglyoxal synthase
MPKQEAMAQLSRPFQIALVAVVLLAGVWLFALQGHSTSTSGSGSGSSAAVPASAPSTSTPAVASKSQPSSSSSSSRAAGATAHAGHGSGSSLGPLSRPINLAHHAAAISEQHEAQIAAKSAQASNEAPAHTSGAPTHAPAASATAAAPAIKAATKSVVKTSTKTAVSTAHKSVATPGTKSAASTLGGQRAVEADLAKGDVVVLLFWNPAGADDATVHAALQPLADAHNRRIAVQYALADQVASFGSITRGVQIFATPTILVIDKRGQTTVLTGVQDTFSVEQAIAEARSS